MSQTTKAPLQKASTLTTRDTTNAKQKETLKRLKASLRYFITTKSNIADTTIADRATHLKEIHSTVTTRIKQGGFCYTCHISNDRVDYLHYPALHFWYKSLVRTTINSIALVNTNDTFLPHINCFENCCYYAGFSDADQFRLWLLEYCYKTLTKKGRI